MTKEEYLSLNKRGCRFLDSYGYIKNYWEPSEHYDYKKVNELIYKQMSESIDFKNIVIAFPVYSGGITCFVGPGNSIKEPQKILIDHCTYPITVKHILHSQGIRFKNGDKLSLQKYSQMPFGCLVVHKGLAHVIDSTSNPYAYIYIKSEHNKQIKLDSYEVENGVTISDKNMMFSGLFIERARKLLKK